MIFKITIPVPVLLLLVATAIIVTGYDNVPFKVKWVTEKEGAVKVDGSTNINKFSCSVSNYANADTIICYKKDSKDVAIGMSGKMAIPVNSFDCINNMMTRDLRKTLKAKDFPMLTIYFISLGKYPDLKQGEEYINGIVNIELAGATKRIGVNFKVSVNNQKIIHLVGIQSIHFSDFNLTPPQKLGGMIKANDKLDVTFNINFKVLTN